MGEGYTGEQAHEIIGQVSSTQMWAGTDALVAAYVVMLGEARHILVKAREFIKRQRIQKLMTPKPAGGVLSAPPKKIEKPVVGKEAEHRRSKVRRANKYWAKKLEAGHTQHTQWLIDERLKALTHPPLIDPRYASALTSDDDPYESARDVPSDPSPYEVTDSEEEHDDVMAYDTETRELERTAQEAFYNGLRDEYKPMIVHMLENPDITVGDLVEAVRKVESVQERHRIQHQDASRYPSSTSTSYHKPVFHKGKDKDKKDDKGNGRGVIKAKAAQIESEVESDTDKCRDSDAERSADENALWCDGYYCYAVCHAEQMDGRF